MSRVRQPAFRYVRVDEKGREIAGEGGFDLERYPAIRAWIERVRSQPGYIPMDR
jgi:glutathione S-transferase